MKNASVWNQQLFGVIEGGDVQAYKTFLQTLPKGDSVMWDSCVTNAAFSGVVAMWEAVIADAPPDKLIWWEGYIMSAQRCKGRDPAMLEAVKKSQEAMHH